MEYWCGLLVSAPDYSVQRHGIVSIRTLSYLSSCVLLLLSKRLGTPALRIRQAISAVPHFDSEGDIGPSAHHALQCDKLVGLAPQMRLASRSIILQHGHPVNRCC